MKLVLTVAVALLGIGFSVTTGAFGGPTEWLTGDANCDSRVDAVDAALVLQNDALLVTSVPCWDAGDANHDYAVNSVDALLILQFQARLYRGLGVSEHRLCPFGGKGTLGEVQQSVDLDGDGVNEMLSIGLDFAQRSELFSVSAFDPASTSYHVAAQAKFPGPSSLGVPGPYSFASSFDIDGNGNAAVICTTQAGANDLFTNVALFSFDAGTGTTLFRGEWLPWARVLLRGQLLVISTRVDWLVGECIVITEDDYQLVGHEYRLARETTIERFRSQQCRN